MLGYFKFAILAFLVLNASATINAELQLTMNKNIAKEALLEAEIKALIAMKQVEQAMIMSSSLPSSLRRCLPLGSYCDPNANRCCSKICEFSAWHRGTICQPKPI